MSASGTVCFIAQGILSHIWMRLSVCRMIADEFSLFHLSRADNSTERVKVTESGVFVEIKWIRLCLGWNLWPLEFGSRALPLFYLTVRRETFQSQRNQEKSSYLLVILSVFYCQKSLPNLLSNKHTETFDCWL